MSAFLRNGMNPTTLKKAVSQRKRGRKQTDEKASQFGRIFTYRSPSLTPISKARKGDSMSTEKIFQVSQKQGLTKPASIWKLRCTSRYMFIRHVPHPSQQTKAARSSGSSKTPEATRSLALDVKGTWLMIVEKITTPKVLTDP